MSDYREQRRLRRQQREEEEKKLEEERAARREKRLKRSSTTKSELTSTSPSPANNLSSTSSPNPITESPPSLTSSYESDMNIDTTQNLTSAERRVLRQKERDREEEEEKQAEEARKLRRERRDRERKDRLSEIITNESRSSSQPLINTPKIITEEDRISSASSSSSSLPSYSGVTSPTMSSPAISPVPGSEDSRKMRRQSTKLVFEQLQQEEKQREEERKRREEERLERRRKRKEETDKKLSVIEQRTKEAEEKAEQKKRERERKLKIEMERKRIEDLYLKDRIMKDVLFPPHYHLSLDDLLSDPTAETLNSTNNNHTTEDKETPVPNMSQISNHLFKEGKLSKEAAFYLINTATELFKNEPNLLELDGPTYVVGDIHGQFYDLLSLMKQIELPLKYNLLFLGDYVDRGHFGTECLMYLYALKINYPNMVYLLRGNHECRNITKHYNFMRECYMKYDGEFYEKATISFDHLPLGAIVKSKKLGDILCVHGGLGPQIKTIQDIQEIDRVKEPPESGPLCDILWSDPIPFEEEDLSSPEQLIELDRLEYEPNSSRGCSYYFGFKATTDFLQNNNLSCIIRAHEVQMNGFKEHWFAHGEGSREWQLNKDSNNIIGLPYLMTVFSAPNYGDQYNNLGGFLVINDDNYKFIPMKSVPHPYCLPNFENIFTFTIPFVTENVFMIIHTLISDINDENIDQEDAHIEEMEIETSQERKPDQQHQQQQQQQHQQQEQESELTSSNTKKKISFAIQNFDEKLKEIQTQDIQIETDIQKGGHDETIEIEEIDFTDQKKEKSIDSEVQKEEIEKLGGSNETCSEDVKNLSIDGETHSEPATPTSKIKNSNIRRSLDSPRDSNTDIPYISPRHLTSSSGSLSPRSLNRPLSPIHTNKREEDQNSIPNENEKPTRSRRVTVSDTRKPHRRNYSLGGSLIFTLPQSVSGSSLLSSQSGSFHPISNSSLSTSLSVLNSPRPGELPLSPMFTRRDRRKTVGDQPGVKKEQEKKTSRFDTGSKREVTFSLELPKKEPKENNSNNNNNNNDQKLTPTSVPDRNKKSVLSHEIPLTKGTRSTSLDSQAPNIIFHTKSVSDNNNTSSSSSSSIVFPEQKIIISDEDDLMDYEESDDNYNYNNNNNNNNNNNEESSFITTTSNSSRNYSTSPPSSLSSPLSSPITSGSHPNVTPTPVTTPTPSSVSTPPSSSVSSSSFMPSLSTSPLSPTTQSLSERKPKNTFQEDTSDERERIRLREFEERGILNIDDTDDELDKEKTALLKMSSSSPSDSPSSSPRKNSDRSGGWSFAKTVGLLLCGLSLGLASVFLFYTLSII